LGAKIETCKSSEKKGLGWEHGGKKDGSSQKALGTGLERRYNLNSFYLWELRQGDVGCAPSKGGD